MYRCPFIKRKHCHKLDYYKKGLCDSCENHITDHIIRLFVQGGARSGFTEDKIIDLILSYGKK